MTSTTLLVAAAADALVAGLILLVARRVLGRSLEGPEERRANRLFGVWWLALAATVLLNALWEVAASVGVTGGPWLVATNFLYPLALCASVWGIVYYLAYVLTGRSRLFWGLTAFYVLYAAALLALDAWIGPTGLNVGTWFVGWDYAHAGKGAALYAVAVVLLLLPQLASSVVLLGLYRRLQDPAQRRRILRTASGVLVWLLVPVVAEMLDLGRFEAWQAASHLVSLAAVLVIASGYYRPPAVAPRPARVGDNAEFAERLRQLV